MGAVQVQPEIGIAGGFRGAGLPSPAGDDRDPGFVDLAIFAAYLQRGQVRLNRDERGGTLRALADELDADAMDPDLEQLVDDELARFDA